MINHTEINRIKWQLISDFESGKKPAEIESTDGTHGIMWEQDQDGFDYALVGCVMPEGVYADFMDGGDSTYGELNAIRFYVTNEATAE